MSGKVRTERDGSVLVVVIENPPINAGSLVVREGLLRAIETLAGDESLEAAVLIGGGSTFIAGSDLREFGKPLEEPQLPAVIAAIESCPKPVVAALHGAALGGGFELALGCDARVATADVVVGLPEVTLGIIPGAGGTQRLPRVVGIARAIQMICSGERLPAQRALDLGLIDAIAEGDLRQSAVAHALTMRGRKQRLRDRSVPAEDASTVADAEAAAMRSGKARPQVSAAIESVKSAATLPIDEALQHERKAFQALRLSTEASALRHLFFAERNAAKRPELSGVAPRPFKSIAVLGAGTMGTGIAICVLDAALDVLLVELDKEALERGRQRIADHYARQVAAGKLAASAAQARQARLESTTDWGQVARVDIVIEAVFEEIRVKQEVFKRLDGIARPGALLASNTSYLDLDVIANATSRPQDVLGLHFFSPANLMRLLEVVRGKDTAPDALATGIELAKRLRKLPVVTANAFGFIGNRIYAAYRRQCEFMLEEGAYPEQVDRALEAFGFAMGPFAVADMSGLDIAWRMRQSKSRDPNVRYVDIPDKLCEQGRLGRKTGSGYYAYESGRKGGSPDPVVRALIDNASAAKGIKRRELTEEEIQLRALVTMVNEAALLLSEGVASQPSDVDVVLANGYGFPKWEGGPVFWATSRDRAQLEEDLDWLAKLSGPGFVRANLASLFAPGER